MTGRAGKMSEKQPQPSRTVRKRGSPGMGRNYGQSNQ